MYEIIGAGLVGGTLLLISGAIWRSPPEERRPEPVGGAYYPVLFVLVAALVIVFWPHIHWSQVAALFRNGL